MAEQQLDLIDRQALLAKKTEMELCFAVSEYDIANAPRVDAVEVVRCKDCAHRDCSGRCCGPQEIQAEEGYDFYVADDDFCSYGERRTDGSES